VPDAVVFDLDGVIVDSEARWDEARRAVTAEHGGTWRPEATRAMMGMSAPEWSRYLGDELGVRLAPEGVNAAVVAAMAEGYRGDLPLLPGAVDAVRALADRWPLGVASSANRELIELVLELAGIAAAFAAIVSSEEVARGKPAPDVYLEVARRLGVDPERCVAVEDSANGLRSAAAAAMVVVAVPSARFPPGDDALALAAARVASPGEVTPELVAAVGR
jgi:HAD superfamily hydrolase (TIGR01509 family)